MFHHYVCLLFIIIPPVTECAYDSEENSMRREFSRQIVAMERLSVIDKVYISIK